MYTYILWYIYIILSTHARMPSHTYIEHPAAHIVSTLCMFGTYCEHPVSNTHRAPYMIWLRTMTVSHTTLYVLHILWALGTLLCTPREHPISYICAQCVLRIECAPCRWLCRRCYGQSCVLVCVCVFVSVHKYMSVYIQISLNVHTNSIRIRSNSIRIRSNSIRIGSNSVGIRSNSIGIRSNSIGIRSDPLELDLIH